MLHSIITVLRHNLFIAGLGMALLLAFLFPHLGLPEGPLQAGLLSKLGVMMIFLLQGLTLRTRQLLHGLRNFRLHAFIQGWIFIGAAMVLLGAALIMRLLGQSGLSEGFIFLALIPTTISSAVALTGAAGGNVPAAIFNTSLSNVIGVFWVPLGCLLFFSMGSELPTGLLGPMLLKLTKLILIPLVLGQAIRPFLRDRPGFKRLSPHFKLINHSIILFIVYAAFCQSLLSGAWQGIQPLSILLLLILCALCLIIIHAANWLSSPSVAKCPGDRICALLCGSQKTLAAGAPMAMAIFGQGETALPGNLGLILLPLLCYHPMQLLLAAMLLPKLSGPRDPLR